MFWLVLLVFLIACVLMMVGWFVVFCFPDVLCRLLLLDVVIVVVICEVGCVVA